MVGEAEGDRGTGDVTGDLVGYRCASCRKGFATVEARSHHYRTVHADRERPKPKRGLRQRVREELKGLLQEPPPGGRW